MPRHCSAGGCKSRDNRDTRNAGITFHKLPKGETRRSLWITNSHRADSWDPQTDFVYFCSKHFTPESFELTGYSGIRRLKEDAFPTVFNSSSTTKCKSAGTQQKQDISFRMKSSCTLDQECIQQETDQSPPSEEPTVQRTMAAAEETHEKISATSQGLSGVEHLSEQKHATSPPSESHNLSPSHFMRRLPPPPGFYLSKEHSYAQLCPLLWRRRYDQVIDCLEKALRELHAARRRESRLRSTVLRLQDKRLKHMLLVSQEGYKDRGQVKQGSNQAENETNTKSEQPVFFEDRCVMEFGCHFLPDTNSSEEERGYCFNCGRGQVQRGSHVAHRLSKNRKDVQLTENEDSPKIQRIVETSTCGTAENTEAIPTVRLESPLRKDVETSSQKKRLLSDMCDKELEAAGQEQHLDVQQQQLFWIQDSAEGQAILVPVSAEDGLQCLLNEENVDKAKTIWMSELDFIEDLEHLTKSNGSLARVATACDDEQGDQHSVANRKLVERREDVREKLKEHVEGFHLQLSTEFINCSE
ncbi:THAP domain-containing protein 7 [Mastacembelus armatus]|uniref:THAP domain-containing protein 7 n=1 Tax=Mastacembelus armatus TaxID=205130 RepID=UPI000E45EAED|nr:THAP domain-containing protein 7 [Mastacembelus armatus]XP_026156621.1 THAP domain-containing protein 7 [Mastacembelus armatus]